MHEIISPALKVVSLFLFGFMLSLFYESTKRFISAVKTAAGKDKLISLVVYLAILGGGYWVFSNLDEKIVSALQWATSLSYIYIVLLAFGIILLVNGVLWLSAKEQLMMARNAGTRKGKLMRWLPIVCLIVFIALFVSLA